MNDDIQQLVFFVIVALIAWLWYRRHQERERLKREQYLAEKGVVDEERQRALDRSIPGDIQRSIRDFRSGVFSGEEMSPLAYIGYRVGITNGLSIGDRQRRLGYCFYADIPDDLPDKYASWGKPATFRRYERMQNHLSMLADQRRRLNNYRHAVGHWDEDRNWFRAEYEATAAKYRRFGYID